MCLWRMAVSVPRLPPEQDWCCDDVCCRSPVRQLSVGRWSVLCRSYAVDLLVLCAVKQLPLKQAVFKFKLFLLPVRHCDGAVTAVAVTAGRGCHHCFLNA